MVIKDKDLIDLQELIPVEIAIKAGASRVAIVRLLAVAEAERKERALEAMRLFLEENPPVSNERIEKLAKELLNESPDEES